MDADPEIDDHQASRVDRVRKLFEGAMVVWGFYVAIWHGGLLAYRLRVWVGAN